MSTLFFGGRGAFWQGNNLSEKEYTDNFWVFLTQTPCKSTRTHLVLINIHHKQATKVTLPELLTELKLDKLFLLLY